MKHRISNSDYLTGCLLQIEYINALALSFKRKKTFELQAVELFPGSNQHVNWKYQ